MNSLARTCLDRRVEAPAPGLPRQHVGVVGVERHPTVGIDTAVISSALQVIAGGEQALDMA
ncbi:hypothetical protein G6038_14220 [Rhodococcus sp. 14C212]|nr:hypothetical protein [Rhodococcus sp. 14C212]